MFSCFFDGLRMSGGYLLYSAPNLRSTFIKKIPVILQKPFEDLAIEIAQSKNKLHKLISQITTLIRHEFNLGIEVDKIANLWNVTFEDFIKKLRLTKLPLTEKDDLLQLWNKYIPQLQELDAEIQKISREIDEMVFDLYGLTMEERLIVLKDIA